MKAKFIVLAPYELNILTTIIDSILLNLASFIIIGDKKKIRLLCLKYNLNYNLLQIYDEIGDINICLKLEELINEKSIDYVLVGDVQKDLVMQVLAKTHQNVLTNFYLLSVNNKLSFGLSYLENSIDFENEALAILESKMFLNKLGLLPNKIVLINDNRQTYNKDYELTKMYLQRLGVNDKIYTHYGLMDLINIGRFSKELDSFSLVYLPNKSYLEILLHQQNIDLKTCQIALTNKHHMLLATGNTSKDILFSIFLFNKFTKQNAFVNAI